MSNWRTSGLQFVRLQVWQAAMVILAAALIGAIWLTATVVIKSEREILLKTAYHEMNNLSLVVEQDVHRTASDLDRILKYLRASFERNGYTADWPRLIKEEFATARQSVQIAVIGRDGTMITSTAMLYPPRPVDLKDREHFLAQRDATDDRLYISRPMIGRASNMWSVQFARRLVDASGAFEGVVVVSLDPRYLTEAYADLDLGKSGGLAIIGDDGLVRAEGGIFSSLLGQPLPTRIASAAIDPDKDVAIDVNETAQGLRVTAARRISGFPLTVLVSRSDFLMDHAWQRNRSSYLLTACFLSLLVLVLSASSLRRRRRYEMKLKNLANFDALTGLSNRHAFYAQLGRLLDTDTNMPFAVHIIDLDGFKEVNDLYGHSVGDKLLTSVGVRIRTTMRSTDMVARLGGDEFAVIEYKAGQPQSGTGIAHRLCREISIPFVIDDLTIDVSASVGVVDEPRKLKDSAAVMRAADLALYEVKSSGKKSVSFFTDRLDEEAQARRDIELGLREALTNNSLDLHYQPIVDVFSGETTGYEALLRWQHPTRGSISPVIFVPIAEQSDLIVRIGEWVMRRACGELASRSDQLTVAVNISVAQFRRSDVYEMTRRVLDETGLPASRLKIEITESLLLNHGEATLTQIRALRRIGVRIAIDDFGTGFSSLTYLQNYPVDCLKIDRSFVKNIGAGSNATAIIRAIVALASDMGMTTVAEGVETVEQMNELSALGCHAVQGYLLCRPKPAEEVLPKPFRTRQDDDLRVAA